MLFASPLWLAGLVPWAGVTVWLLLGRRQRVAVPFVQLWKGPTDGPRAKSALTRPPLSVLLAILAMLGAVLASARPALIGGGATVIVIVDRGITMSAHGAEVKTLSQALAAALRDRFGAGPVDLLTVPNDRSIVTDRSHLAEEIDHLPASNLATGQATADTVRRQLSQTQQPVIVLTDQSIQTADPRAIRVPPTTPVKNVGLVNIAASAAPHGQVMVVIRNSSAARTAVLHVASAGRAVDRPIQLPAESEQTVFVDVAELGSTVSVTLDAPDDLPVDNQAWLVNESSAAEVVEGAGLPEPLHRMISVYRHHRRVVEGRHVLVVTDLQNMPDDPAVVLASGVVATTQPNSKLYVEDHPLTRDVHFPVDAVGGESPAGWKPIVTVGNGVLIAVRETPVRQVWVCLDSVEWPRTVDYVIFWTNVFDWLGGGEGDYLSHSLDELKSTESREPLAAARLSSPKSEAASPAVGGEPLPGVYRDADGSLRAFNAIDVRFPAIAPNDWQKKIAALPRSSTDGIDLTPACCIVALVLMLFAILSRHHFAQPRTIDSMT